MLKAAIRIPPARSEPEAGKRRCRSRHQRALCQRGHDTGRTGLEGYIITRRLERCRRALDDPAQARRTIGDIAFSWGFSDLSRFGRRFKAEFGCAPGEYRERRTA